MLKLLLALVLAVVVVAAGVVAFVVLEDDDDNGSTGTRTPVPSSGATGEDATQLLQQASDAAAEVSSFHFVLTHENGTTPLPLNLELETAEGDILVPGSMKAEVDAEALGVNVTVNVIGIEDRTWVTNPFTRDWQELPDTNIRDFADPASLVESVLPAMKDAQVSDGEKVDGVDTRLVTGNVDSGALQQSLGIAEPGHDVMVQAWIGVEDSLPRRVRLSGPLSAAEDPDVVREVELSRYNQPVEITPPE